MNLKECYAELGGSFESVMGRLRSETMVRKFVLKFPADGSYALLRSSLDAENYQEAFRAAHTIKGVCQNLSFDKLYESSHRLTEALRDGACTPDVPELLTQVEEDYERTIAAIAKLD